MTTSDAARIRFRDTRPYFTPDSLDELQGPAKGVIELPHAVLWLEHRTVDLDSPGGTPLAYQALIAEGLPDEQRALLNRTLLINVWTELNLDQRVVDLWESRFPELSAAEPAPVPE